MKDENGDFYKCNCGNSILSPKLFKGELICTDCYNQLILTLND